jgi:hypothetical protein
MIFRCLLAADPPVASPHSTARVAGRRRASPRLVQARRLSEGRDVFLPARARAMAKSVQPARRDPARLPQDPHTHGEHTTTKIGKMP